MRCTMNNGTSQKPAGMIWDPATEGPPKGLLVKAKAVQAGGRVLAIPSRKQEPVEKVEPKEEKEACFIISSEDIKLGMGEHSCLLMATA